MRLSAVTFWSMILAVVAIDASAGTDVISNHQAINQIVVAASSVALVGLLLNQAFPAPATAVAGWLRTLPLIGAKPDPFVPLADAVRELYEANLDEDLGRWVRGQTNGGEVEIYDWLIYWATSRSVTVYGRRTASTVLETIPPVRFTMARVTGGAKLIMQDSRIEWRDLQVKRGAFRSMIPVLGDISLPSGPQHQAY